MVKRLLRSWQLMAAIAVLAFGFAAATAMAEAQGADIPTAADGFGEAPPAVAATPTAAALDLWQIDGTGASPYGPAGLLADLRGPRDPDVLAGPPVPEGVPTAGPRIGAAPPPGPGDAAEATSTTTTSTTTTSATTTSAAPATADAGTSAAPTATDSGLQPSGVRIPAIAVRAPTIPLGVMANGEIEVPEDPADAGWWADGPTPGAPGPTVVLGHVNDWSGPGVFSGLHTLTPGDEVFVDRVDGTTVVYRVSAGALYDKDEFPTEAVYLARSGDTSLLRLVTCGGTLDPESGSYESNYVVYAEQVRTEAPDHLP